MPAPGSEIPSALPADFVAAIARGTPAGRAPARGRRAAARAVRAYKPSVPETEFKKCFPLPYRVEAVSMYEAKRQGWETDRSYWQFLERFQYASPKWGTIEIPKGFYTDFASVPPQLHSIIDDDSPIILLPSAPHDFLFTKRKDKNYTRGWIGDTQLSLTEVNRVLTESMSFCGADGWVREAVFLVVEAANQVIKNEFRH
jgi:Protein of unknown function (DUF1353)